MEHVELKIFTGLKYKKNTTSILIVAVKNCRLAQNHSTINNNERPRITYYLSLGLGRLYKLQDQTL